jgi:hypothetical protein
MSELNKIQYKFVMDVTRFFVDLYGKDEIKDFDQIIRNVKSQAPFVLNMGFTFDETIWFPIEPDTIRNLIEFKVQLNGKSSWLPFRLFINKGLNQEIIIPNSRWLKLNSD